VPIDISFDSYCPREIVRGHEFEPLVGISIDYQAELVYLIGLLAFIEYIINNSFLSLPTTPPDMPPHL
jgi:hypothetical protein